MSGLADYEREIAPSREAFFRSETVTALLSRPISADVLLGFLVEFAARGVAMTAPVDGWIRRAGERCRSHGWSDLGDALVRHADEEAGHDQYHASDCRFLVGEWNDRRAASLDADALLARPMGPAVRAYIAFHEEVLSSSTPYRQLAIEREIEGLSVSGGTGLIQRIEHVLGARVAENLKFLRSHVRLDRAHTELNQRLMGDFVTEEPDALGPLLEAGKTVLGRYEAFVVECLDSARTLVGSRKA